MNGTSISLPRRLRIKAVRRIGRGGFPWGLAFLAALTVGSEGVAQTADEALASPASEENLQRFDVAEPHLGTTVRLAFYASSPQAATTVSQAVFDRIEAENRIFSDYLADSELSRLSQAADTGPQRISPELFAVLAASQSLAERTDGAFDVTVGPIVALWRRARRTGRFPSPANQREALARVGYQKLQLDPEARTAELELPRMRLDLGGIAKGAICDAALDEFRRHGIPRALVDIGGDMALGDDPPDGPGWRVGLPPTQRDAAPTEFLVASRVGVAASGDLYQYVEIDGVRYSHLIDPRTGIGTTARRQAVVVAPTAQQADALASAACVLTREESIRLIDETPGCAARLTALDGEELKSVVTKRWNELRIVRAD